jgi:S-adenosylmethionine/arginine decarboxylase-like enzyme
MRTSTLYNKQSTYWPVIRQFVVAIQTENFPTTEESLRIIADTIVSKLNLTTVQTFVHPFTPYGHTLVYVLSQSHLAIHTWPEHHVLHIDLVTCSELEQTEVDSVLHSIFSSEKSFFEWL